MQTKILYRPVGPKELELIGSGFVTKFHINADYVKKFEEQNVGGDIHNELWVPAEELEEFNDNIIGVIEVTKKFYKKDQ